MATQKANLINELFDLGRYINSNQENKDLTMIQLRTVMFVQECHIVKPTKIAKYFSITPASVTSQIDNLVEKGWLERIYNSNDKRVIEVSLSKKGQNQLPKELKDLEKNNEWILTTLSKDEQEKSLQLLKKLNKSARK